jgi:hypothetical protein
VSAESTAGVHRWRMASALATAPAGRTDTPHSPATRSASRRVVRSGSVSLERRPDPRSRRPRPAGSADLIQVRYPGAVSAAMRRNERLGESLGQRVVPGGVGRRAQRSRRPRHRSDATAHGAPAAVASPVPLIHSRGRRWARARDPRMRGQQLVFGLPSGGDEFVQAAAHR